jgi:hypothetical protein
MTDGEPSQKCAVIKCSVNGKDAGNNPVFGLFLGAVEGTRLIFHGELFSSEPLDTDAPLSELYALIMSKAEGRDETLVKYETSFGDYVATSRMFQDEKKLDDVKALEHQITYFCTSALRLNTISFLEITEMSERDLYLTMPNLPRLDAGNEEESAECGPPSGEDEKEEKSLPDVVVACDPILDPVAGVALSDLAAGDVIYCKLKEDSVYYGMMSSAQPGFDGIVTGAITAVQTNEMGRVVVAINLAEGVTGALQLANTVRIKILKKKQHEQASSKKPPAMTIAIAMGGVILFLLIMALLLYMLS